MLTEDYVRDIQLKGPVRQKSDRKNTVGKRRVVERILMHVKSKIHDPNVYFCLLFTCRAKSLN